MTLCLYAIVSTRRSAVRVNGMREEALTLVPAGRVSGVVGRLAAVPRPTSRNLRAYHDAIGRLSDAVPALLPVRFGTTFQSPTDVAHLLRARSSSLRTALTRVRRRVQMTVRFVSSGERRPAIEPPMPAAAQSSGTSYLQWRASAARRLAAWEPCVELNRVVRRWVKAEVIDERQGVVSVYHLVPRAAAGRYRRAVEDGAFTTRLQVTGPFPPFAFADPVAARLAAPESRPATRGARRDGAPASKKRGVGRG